MPQLHLKSGLKNNIKNWLARSYREQICVVARHAERADIGFDNEWPMSSDAANFPFDPPLSEIGVTHAYELGCKIRSAVLDWGDVPPIVVSSPYKRCVQTACEVCKVLNAALLIDLEVGEVFGPKIFGGAEPKVTYRPFSLIKSYAIDQGVTICSKIIGRQPVWPETLEDARLRFAKRFLKYVNRGIMARRNFLVISHADAVATFVSCLPGAPEAIRSVEPCGFFTAQRRFSTTPKKSSKQLTSNNQQSSDEKDSLLLKEDDEPPDDVHGVSPKRWKIHTEGILSFRPKSKKRTEETFVTAEMLGMALQNLPNEPLGQVCGALCEAPCTPHSPASTCYFGCIESWSPVVAPMKSPPWAFSRKLSLGSSSPTQGFTRKTMRSLSVTIALLSRHKGREQLRQYQHQVRQACLGKSEQSDFSEVLSSAKSSPLSTRSPTSRKKKRKFWSAPGWTSLNKNCSPSSKNGREVKRPAGLGDSKPRRNSWDAGKQSQTDGNVDGDKISLKRTDSFHMLNAPSTPCTYPHKLKTSVGMLDACGQASVDNEIADAFTATPSCKTLAVDGNQTRHVRKEASCPTPKETSNTINTPKEELTAAIRKICSLPDVNQLKDVSLSLGNSSLLKRRLSDNKISRLHQLPFGSNSSCISNSPLSEEEDCWFPFKPTSAQLGARDEKTGTGTIVDISAENSCAKLFLCHTRTGSKTSTTTTSTADSTASSCMQDLSYDPSIGLPLAAKTPLTLSRACFCVGECCCMGPQQMGGFPGDLKEEEEANTPTVCKVRNLVEMPSLSMPEKLRKLPFDSNLGPKPSQSSNLLKRRLASKERASTESNGLDSKDDDDASTTLINLSLPHESSSEEESGVPQLVDESSVLITEDFWSLATILQDDDFNGPISLQDALRSGNHELLGYHMEETLSRRVRPWAGG